MVASDLKVVQLAKEVAWGTGVPATARLMGVTDASMTPNITTARVADIGSLAPAWNSVQTGQSAMASIEMAATYEDIIFPLSSVVLLDAAPVGANPYVWTYPASLGSAGAIQPFTVEYGAAGASYEMNGGIGTKLVIKGDVDDVWRITWDLEGEVIVASALTALTTRVVEMIRMADTVLTVDAVGGTMGTTAVAASLIGFELTVNTNRHTKTFAGSANPVTYGDARWEGSLKLTLEFNATVKAYFDALLTANVKKQIRLKATSSAKIAQIDFCGTLGSNVELFGDRDGNMIIETTWDGEYNATYANWLSIEITNAVATLP